MLVGFNVLLIIIVLFIAYWWGNQGLFSAILHLLCVIVAGGLAFAVWEPLVVRFLLRGNAFDDYAWGITLVLFFAVTLVIFRIALDKLAPANIGVPHWVNLVFGGIAGFCSGVLTIGIFVIAAGHVQSSSNLMGYRGYGRLARTGEVGRVNSLWVPYDKLTSDFYSLLSVTSYSSSRPLRDYTPDLYQQATLLRDSYNNGRGKLTLRPSAARVKDLYYAEKAGSDRYFVKMTFDLGAQDFGEQLTLSASQIRLISAPVNGGKPDVVHPIAWRQYSGYHFFDNVSHYISSEPAKQSSDVEIEFEVPPGFTPRFVQVRGIRYSLPREADPAPGHLLVTGGRDAAPVEIPVGGEDIQDMVRVTNDIRPVIVTKNNLPPSIKERDNYLTTGKATFQRGRGGAASSLRMKGIFEPTGTKAVRLNVSRGGPADIFRYQSQIPDDAEMTLVDALGGEYTPIGYLYASPAGTEIALAPNTRLPHLEDIPALPTSGQHTLELIFYVTQGATITGFRVGNIPIGFCDVPVPVDE